MREFSGYTVINADGLIFGRMASVVARRLLLGERIAIVNAERAIISGKRESIFQEYKERLRIRTLVQPAKGPFHARSPDRILRRTIRGMLPWDRTRGKEAFRRFSAFIGVPLELKDAKLATVAEAKADRLRGRYVRLADIAAEIGWKPL